MTPEQREQELRACWEAVGKDHYVSFAGFKEIAERDASTFFRAWSARAEIAFAEGQKLRDEIRALKDRTAEIKGYRSSFAPVIEKPTDTRRAEFVAVVCAHLTRGMVIDSAIPRAKIEMPLINKALEGK